MKNKTEKQNKLIYNIKIKGNSVQNTINKKINEKIQKKINKIYNQIKINKSKRKTLI